MVSNKIALSPEGEGMSLALQEAERVAEEAGLSHDNVLVLRLITEEMLAMLRSVTHNLKAEYWLVWDGTDFELHLSAKQSAGRWSTPPPAAKTRPFRPSSTSCAASLRRRWRWTRMSPITTPPPATTHPPILPMTSSKRKSPMA